jgi:hypothetical protein
VCSSVSEPETCSVRDGHRGQRDLAVVGCRHPHLPFEGITIVFL